MHADQHGMFLWTIDKMGFVRPWSHAARTLVSPTFRDDRGYVQRLPRTLSQALLVSEARVSDPSYETFLSNWLETAAFEGVPERATAREALLIEISDLWAEWRLPPSGLMDGWKTWILRALEQAEIGGFGQEGAHIILDGADEAMSVLANDRATASTGAAPWTQFTYWQARSFASRRVLELAREAYFIDEDRVPPTDLVGMVDAAYGTSGTWRSPEGVWREFLHARHGL